MTKTRLFITTKPIPSAGRALRYQETHPSRAAALRRLDYWRRHWGDCVTLRVRPV